MKIIGIDFASRPRRSKPLTCIEAERVRDYLRVEAPKEWPNAEAFGSGPRLQHAGVHIPGLQNGDPQRIVVEACPGALARTLVQRKSYTQDTGAKQTPDYNRRVLI